MATFIFILNKILPALYFLTTCCYGFYFLKKHPQAGRYMTISLRVTLGLHLSEVMMRGIYYHHFPLATIYETASVLSLALVTIYVYLEYHLKVKTTGFFILIPILLLQLFSSLFIGQVPKPPEVLNSPLFVFHTTTAVFGYSGFTISAIYSFLYLLLFYEIKQHHFGIIYNRLPSLEGLHEMNFKAAKVGFLFLTIAIILGVVWSRKAFPGSSALDPKPLLAFLTWAIYALEISGHKFLNWSGKRLAYISLMGFAMILFSVVAVNYLFTSFHQFH